MLHVVDFRTSTGDTGEPNSDSIQPYTNGESADQVTFRRPTENTRARTETMRQLLREHIMLRDLSDSGVLLNGGGTISVTAGTGFIVAASSDFYVTPFATAGSGVDEPYTVSTKASLSVGTGVNELVFTSVQKQYEGSTFPNADANAISIEIVDTGSLTVAVNGASGEENNVYITIDSGTTTLNDVISAVAGHGTASLLVVASLGTTAVGTNPCQLWGPTEWAGDFTARFLRGGVPGVTHEILSGDLVSFFATTDNQLLKGDTLAIWYDKLVNTSTTGGRLQSTPENTNINVGGALFNTRVEPEKIPNCIPICKRIDDFNVIFINGAVISTSAPATLWVDSPHLTGAENGTLQTLLNWDRIETGPDHNPPTTIRQALDNVDGRLDEILDEIEAARSSGSWDRLNTGPDHNPPATLLQTFDNVDGHIDNLLDEVEAARDSVSYGAVGSLDARLEAPELEIVAARNSAVFGAQSTLDARLEAAETHATTIRTVGPIASGRQYEGESGLRAAVALGGLIIVDSGAYVLTAPMNTSLPTHIIGKGGANSATAVDIDFGAQPSTFSAGAENSVIENCYLRTSAAIINPLTLAADNCTLRHCKFKGRMIVDGDYCLVDACTSDTELNGFNHCQVSGTGSTVRHCSFVHATQEEMDILSISGTRCVVENCVFTIAGGVQAIDASGTYTARAIYIVADLDLVSTNWVVDVDDGCSVDGLHILATGSAPITQPLLYIEAATVRNVVLDLNNREARMQAKEMVFVRSTAARSGVLEKFTLRNFELPYGADSLDNFRGLISCYSVTSTPTIVQHGRILGMGQGTPSGTMDGILISGSVGNTGPAYITDISIDTSGVTHTTGTRYCIGGENISDDSRVTACHIFGTGLFSSGILFDTVYRGEIVDNKVFTQGDWDSLIAYNQTTTGFNTEGGKIIGNTVRSSGALTNNPIQVLGVSGVLIEYVRVENNAVLNNGGSVGNEGIYLQYAEKCITMGNLVETGIGTNGIGYGPNVASMFPATNPHNTLNHVA